VKETRARSINTSRWMVVTRLYLCGHRHQLVSTPFHRPGGHTRSQTPPYSATLPLARAIQRIYQLRVPTRPSSNLNIGMLGGSEVVNAKASDAWFTVDLRSTSNEVIADLEKQIKVILDGEAARVGMKLRLIFSALHRPQ